jgi:hypothetical protein
LKAEGRSRYATDLFAARNEASYTGVAGPNDAGNADRTAPGNAINLAAYGCLLSLFILLTDSTIAWNAAPYPAGTCCALPGAGKINMVLPLGIPPIERLQHLVMLLDLDLLLL